MTWFECHDFVPIPISRYWCLRMLLAVRCLVSIPPCLCYHTMCRGLGEREREGEEKGLEGVVEGV